MVPGKIKLLELADHPYFLSELKKLLIEYGHYMYNDLRLVDGKENFFEDLKYLPTVQYQPPSGTFVLALHDDSVAGCVGIKKFKENSCEMKRMYIRPGNRRMGIGKLLCEFVIKWCGDSPYKKILLDTNAEMKEAILLYRKCGFIERRPYCLNENNHPVFMEYTL